MYTDFIEGKPYEIPVLVIVFTLIGCFVLYILFIILDSFRFNKCKHGNRRVCYFCEKEGLSIDNTPRFNWPKLGWDNMGKDARKLIMGIILILLFAYFVYPTPWHYSMYQGIYPVKINWITGETYILKNNQWNLIQSVEHKKVDPNFYSRDNIMSGKTG